MLAYQGSITRVARLLAEFTFGQSMMLDRHAKPIDMTDSVSRHSSNLAHKGSELETGMWRIEHSGLGALQLINYR